MATEVEALIEQVGTALKNEVHKMFNPDNATIAERFEARAERLAVILSGLKSLGG